MYIVTCDYPCFFSKKERTEKRPGSVGGSTAEFRTAKTVAINAKTTDPTRFRLSKIVILPVAVFFGMWYDVPVVKKQERRNGNGGKRRMPDAREHIEYLSPTLRLAVSAEHTFGTDALLLASFACPKKNDAAADLGAGCGIIPFYWLRCGCKGRIFGVDIQQSAFDLMQKSVGMNAGIENFTPLCADLRDLRGTIGAGSLDLVVMNPPYKPAGTGILSDSETDRIARHETACTLADVCESASYLLRYGGRFALCIRPERLCDAICEMRAHKLEPKRLRMVAQRPGLAPWLALVEGRSGGKPGLTVLPELCIESDEMRAIVGEYRKE